MHQLRESALYHERENLLISCSEFPFPSSLSNIIDLCSLRVPESPDAGPPAGITMAAVVTNYLIRNQNLLLFEEKRFERVVTKQLCGVQRHTQSLAREKPPIPQIQAFNKKKRLYTRLVPIPTTAIPFSTAAATPPLFLHLRPLFLLLAPSELSSPTTFSLRFFLRLCGLPLFDFYHGSASDIRIYHLLAACEEMKLSPSFFLTVFLWPVRGFIFKMQVISI